MSAVLPLANAVYLLPGALMAAVSAALALKLAFGGLAANWKAAGTGAGAGSAAMAAAERRVATAQREAKAAQDAINTAREAAAQRINDLARELAGARLDERGAVLAVARAEQQLREARRGGNALDIREAELAYEQALQTVQDVGARTQQLANEQKDAATKGVEGSDQVQEALQRQRDAIQELADAQKALATAGSGGGGKGLPQLSAAGYQLLAALKAVTPQWQALQRTVQQRTFAGVGADIRALSAAWLPMLHRRLGEMGGAWNATIRSAAGLALTKPFITDTSTALHDAAVGTDRLGRALTPVISGLRHIGTVAASFLPGLGQGALNAAQRFERWAAAARESGKLRQWIGDSLTVLRELWQLGGNVVGIILAIFRAGGNGGATLDGLIRGTAAMKAWLSSAEGQQKVAGILGLLRSVLTDFGTALSQVGPVLVGTTDNMGLLGTSASVLSTVMGWLADHAGLIAAIMPVLLTLFIANRTIQTLSLPVEIARIVVMARLNGAMRANTAQLAIANGVERTGLLLRARALVVSAAERTSKIVMTAVNWALSASTWAVLGPILLVVVAVAALAAGVIYAYTHWGWFRKAVGYVKDGLLLVWDALKFVWSWLQQNWVLVLSILTGPIGAAVIYIVRHWDSIVATVKGLPGRIASAASGMWDGIKNAFKGAINWIIDHWNGLKFGVPKMDLGPLGSYGGQTFRVPQIPRLDVGGRVLATGLAVIHRGEEVVPAAEVQPRAPAVGGRSGHVTVQLVMDNRSGGPVDGAIATMIQYLIRTGQIRLATVDGTRVKVG